MKKIEININEEVSSCKDCFFYRIRMEGEYETPYCFHGDIIELPYNPDEDIYYRCPLDDVE